MKATFRQSTVAYLAALAAVGLSACNAGPALLPGHRFACSADSECTGGTRCIGGECTQIVSVSCPNPVAESCGDSQDNDCDGVTDCDDPSCGGQPCNVRGGICTDGACTCSGNGGTTQASETVCDDGKDNDCDGLTDCQEPGCAGATCGTGLICTAGLCGCDGAAPEPEELTCDDAGDNDCDGSFDCDDATCAGRACGDHGRVCGVSGCACSGNGGTAQATESSCGDGFDNDCDGASDCADSDCPSCAPYTTTPVSLTATDACALPGRSQYLVSTDDGITGQLPMLIPFAFYGQTVSQFWLASDGYLGFGTPMDPPGTNLCLPSTTQPRPAILAFADDINPRTEGVCVGVEGTAPNRKMVVTWKGVGHDDFSGASLTFSVHLLETTNVIELVYTTMTGADNATGGRAVIGLQNASATSYVQYKCKNGDPIASGTAIRFTPP